MEYINNLSKYISYLIADLICIITYSLLRFQDFAGLSDVCVLKNTVQLQKRVNMFAGYILWLMMVYLTNVWKLELVHAAAIINVWMGLSKVLPVVFAHLADAFLGNFFVVLFSSLSSMIVSTVKFAKFFRYYVRRFRLHNKKDENSTT